MTNSPIKHEYDVFISYSRINTKWVNKFVTDLKSHDIKPWFDILDIQVGDIVHTKIEEGIEKSNYFCFIISDASLKSYYVRRIELESAFAKMINDKREEFILPIVLQKPKEPLPLSIRKYHYLDFSKSYNYTKLLFKLVRKIKFSDDKFTGSRWYSGIDVSPLGMMIGVGQMTHKSFSGYSVEMHYIEGKAETLEMYVDGKLDCHKKLFYDNDRVSKIERYREGQRTERLVYFYSSSGRRERKQFFGSNEYPYMEARYDVFGRRTIEKWLEEDGSLDSKRPYASREFTYNDVGEVARIIHKDSKGNEVNVKE